MGPPFLLPSFVAGSGFAAEVARAELVRSARVLKLLLLLGF
jgi:hypothetical protein